MTPTPSQTVGPFFGFALPFEQDAHAVPASAKGAIRIEGQLLDGAGEPVPDGLLEVSRGDQFARCRTDVEGAFHFTVRKPVAESGAPFLHVTVFGRGLLRHLNTRLYFPDESNANDADPVLRLVDALRRPTLVARREGQVLRFDVRLQGEGETVFFE
ncbi:MAG: protocatechuate 3,4-dioxygenase subunit alpha [Chloroflexi bacterium]|nr:MAG: protocatechuate 3,4-dioxygenase subunit alpha [Chloroflexota bacterium]TMF76503.1 MAG: protocatechuate 3,4-dioxygenase subunit alpha [Chloroflexota bacterium]TMF94781.1 MAG: protocatechuate 3,4-dioxygenase subunit alpha [Chloroflexota bacterium]